jgi:hypothetical protein
MKTMLLCSTLLIAATAHADTIGTFSATGPGSSSASTTGDSAMLTYSIDSTEVYSGVSWTYTAVATTSETLDLSYVFAGNNAYWQASNELSAFDSEGTFEVTGGNSSGGYNETGTVTLNLVQGESYGFIVYGRNDDSESFVTGSVDLTEVSVVQRQGRDLAAAPEPSALVLMGTGLLTMGGLARRRLVP